MSKIWATSGRQNSGRRSGEQVADFVVGGLGKICVVLADADEGERAFQANDIIGSVPKILAGTWRADGNSNNNFRGALLTQRSYRSPHGRAGGKSVIDQNDGTIFKLRRRTVCPIISFAPLQFLAFNRGHHLDDRLRIRHDIKHVFVQNADAAGSDCAHGEFFMAGHAEFAHNKNIERNTEAPGDLKCDRDTTTREAENNDVVAPGVTEQLLRELPTRISSVLKNLG
jgi:hypothetical protein